MRALNVELRPLLRGLLRRPSLTLTAVLTLGLGIGAATAIYAVVSAVLLQPLPWPDSAGLVHLSERHPGGQGQLRTPLFSDLAARPWAWEREPSTVEGIAAFSRERVAVEQDGAVARVLAARVSPELFGLLRTRPRLGRFFLPEDATAEAAPVVVLAEGFWRERFGGEEGAVSRTLLIDGRPHTIIGVTPPGFGFPKQDVRLYLPSPRPVAAPGSIDLFSAIARLRPGVTPAQAAAEGTAAARSIERPMVADLLFGKGGPVEVVVERYQDQLTAPMRPALVVLACGVALLLLVAIANVANLLLAHGFARQREVALRTALGASRRRVFGQVLLESLLLALAGAACGLLLAGLSLEALSVIAPAGLPRLDEVRFSWQVGGFALLLAALAGLLAGSVPALRVSGADLAGRLRQGDKGTSSGQGLGLRSGLLVAEAALCLMLLVGAALLGRSFASLMAVDPGFTSDGVLTAELSLSDGGSESRIDAASIDTLLARLRSLPGVEAAGAGNMIPLGGATAMSALTLPFPDASGAPVVARARLYNVSPGYAEALGLRLRAGRLLSSADSGVTGRRAVVVNEDFVRQFLPRDRVAVGLEIPRWFDEEGTVAEIVGVVGNVLKEGLDDEARPEIFVTAGSQQVWSSQAALVVRGSGALKALAGDLPRLVREVDRRLSVDAVAPLSRRISESVARPRFALAILAGLSLAALCLAAIGLYGALSYAVALRRRELGVRAALGADRQDLLRLVLSQGLGVTLGGVVLGLAGAAAGTRLMQTLLFGITAADVASYAIASLLLLLVAAVASLVPARRAAASDPAEVLRAD